MFAGVGRYVCVGAYFCMNMILITLSSFLAIIVINTHIRGDRKNTVPKWLRRVGLIFTASSVGDLTNIISDW